MDKYTELYNNMEPGIVQSAASWGISAATLGAMAKRGLVEVFEGKPKKYRRAEKGLYARIVELANGYEFFALFKRDEELGMLCRVKDGRVLDAWDKPYNVEGVYKMRLNSDFVSLDEN